MTRLGLVNPETWGFMRELEPFLAERYATERFVPRTVATPLFKERVARFLFNRDLAQFVARQDLVFFEWATE